MEWRNEEEELSSKAHGGDLKKDLHHSAFLVQSIYNANLERQTDNDLEQQQNKKPQKSNETGICVSKFDRQKIRHLEKKLKLTRIETG